MQAVFDQEGTLPGVVSADAIQPVASTATPAAQAGQPPPTAQPAPAGQAATAVAKMMAARAAGRVPP
ncbi:MAG: hypothetical protein ACRDOK_05465 [Streptosporangiaceae bacterium]